MSDQTESKPTKRCYIRRAPNPKITGDVAVDIIRRVRQGEPKAVIARDLGIHREGVYRTLRKLCPELLNKGG